MKSAEGESPKSLTVAWISYFPIEWLDSVPEEVHRVRRQHPATWQQSLLVEFENNPKINLHILVVRSTFERDLRFERNGVTFHLLKTRPGWRAPTLFWLDTLRIRRVLREIRPDVVHAWGTEDGAALVALRLGYPHLISIQGLLKWFRELIPLNRHEKLAAHLECFSLKRAKLVSAESADTTSRVRQVYPNAPVLHIEHPPMHHFFRISRAQVAPQVRFLSVGTMGYRKGSDLYLAALNRLAGELEFKCVAIGRPNEAFLAPLKSALTDTLWRRLEFRHSLTDEQMDQEYGLATLMVMPSRADTGPVAVKEAVVAGVPVVASEMGGVPEYVTPDRNGYICRPNDLDDLVSKLRMACYHSLFCEGKVDAHTLMEKRRHLDPQQAAHKFLNAYTRAFQEQGKPQSASKGAGSGSRQAS